MDGLEEMARGCFGYGRWDAPYWLIGLEEGMSGTLDNRIRAFQKLDKDGLCDSRKFHHEIGFITNTRIPRHWRRPGGF